MEGQTMTHRYRITLHSPMGPREGELTLTGEVNGAVTGILSVLGFQQPVATSGWSTACAPPCRSWTVSLCWN